MAPKAQLAKVVRIEAHVGACYSLSYRCNLGASLRGELSTDLCILTHWTTQGLGPTLEMNLQTGRTLGRVGSSERWTPSILPSDFWGWSFSWLIWLNGCQPFNYQVKSSLLLGWRNNWWRVTEEQLTRELEFYGWFPPMQNIHGPKPEDVKRLRVSHLCFFRSFTYWCTAYWLKFNLPFIFLRGHAVELGRWGLMAEFGKRIFIQATKVWGPVCDVISIPVCKVAKLPFYW